MYHIRRGDPQKLSMISDVKCEIRMLKILRSILLFSFFRNFFFLINVINKHIIPNTFFTILNYRNYVYFSVLGINCTFWADFLKLVLFLHNRAQYSTTELLDRVRTCISRASQYKKHAAIMYLPANYHENIFLPT